MKETILEIMRNNFDEDKLNKELETIIIDTMDELYHALAIEILEEFDPGELMEEVAEELLEIPF